jgi:hypothetical protein
MSWRTTGILFLVLLLVGGVVYWQSQSADQDAATPTPALAPGTFNESVRLVPDVAREDVVRLEISRFPTGEQVVYEQEEGSWTKTVPTTTQVISSTVNTPLQSLLDASSRRTLPPDANPAEAYGLAEPSATIIVATRREGAIVRHTFYLGNLTPAEDAYYLQKAGDPRIHIVASFALNNMLDLLASP